MEKQDVTLYQDKDGVRERPTEEIRAELLGKIERMSLLRVSAERQLDLCDRALKQSYEDLYTFNHPEYV